MAEDTSDSSKTGDLARIKSRIESLVEQRFARGAELYYLSQLGNDLGTDRQRVEQLTGQKLADFIQKEFNFETGRTGQHQNILFIVRPNHLISEVEAAKPGLPRYRSRFWAAFAVPLPEGQRRFIHIPTLGFGPEESFLGGTETDVREIGPEYVTQSGETRAAFQIADCIERWLQTQQLDRAPFLAQPRHALGDALPSLLEQLLNALDGEQLKRISLPLDIIRTLNERRGR
jgi:hypothetical protein